MAEPVSIVLRATTSKKRAERLVKLLVKRYRATVRRRDGVIELILPQDWLALELTRERWRYSLKLTYTLVEMRYIEPEEKLLDALLARFISDIVNEWSTKLILKDLGDREIDFIADLYEGAAVKAYNLYQGTACSMIIPERSGLFATALSASLRLWRDILSDESGPQPLHLQAVRTFTIR